MYFILIDTFIASQHKVSHLVRLVGSGLGLQHIRKIIEKNHSGNERMLQKLWLFACYDMRLRPLMM
jgi:hypothetical protein